MLPKSGLACLLLFSLIGIGQPALSQAATESGVSQVSSLETRFFAHSYTSEALPKRLARLENFVYGSESQEPLQCRLEKLDNVLGSKGTVSAASVGTRSNAPSPARTNTRASVHVNAAADAECAWSKTKYPRITDLERELLERTFESEAAPTRVARLEEHVFGRVWATQTDLALRLDRLGEYAFMSPKIEELERAELLRLSYLQNACYRPEQLRMPPSRAEQMRLTQANVSESMQAFASSGRNDTHTVVDEIESLERMLFGKISASKPIGQRVDALELSLGGASQSDKQRNITSRVALLMAKFNSNYTLQSRSGV